MKKWIFKLFFPAFENEDAGMAVTWFTQFKVALDILVNGIILILLSLLVFYVDPFATMFSSFSIEKHQKFVEDLVFNNLSKWPLIFPVLFLAFLINLLMASRVVSPMVLIQRRFKKYFKHEEKRSAETEGKDYFHQVATMVDELQSSLNRDMLFLRDEVARIESMVEEGSVDNPEAARQVEEALAKIQTHFDLENLKGGEEDVES